MTFRIEISRQQQVVLIAFYGLLDAQALEEISEAVRAHRFGPGAVRVLLGPGTEIERACLEQLRAIEGIEVTAASPYLTRWLRQRGIK